MRTQLWMRTCLAAILLCTALLTAVPAFGQTPEDVTAGVPVTGTLGASEILYYRMPVEAGQKVFALLDKGGLPGRGYSDDADQAVELTPAQAGYCYVRVESDSTAAAAFSITGHNEATFPKLAIGQTVSGQSLAWNGDKNWYRLEVDAASAGKSVYIRQLKQGDDYSSLQLKYGSLPGNDPDVSAYGR